MHALEVQRLNKIGFVNFNSFRVSQKDSPIWVFLLGKQLPQASPSVLLSAAKNQPSEIVVLKTCNN